MATPGLKTRRPDQERRAGLRRGGAHHRRVPPHGAGRRVRRLRDGAHHLHDRARARRSLHRAAGVRHAPLSSWRFRRAAGVRHQGAEGSRRQEGRRARLFGHHRRLDARHLRQRVRSQLRQGDLGGRRRGACHDAEASAQCRARARGQVARRHDGERRAAGRLQRPRRHRPRRSADRRLGEGRADQRRGLSGADRQRRAGRGRLVQAHRHLSDPRADRGQDRGAVEASVGGQGAVRCLRRGQEALHRRTSRAAKATRRTTRSIAA